MGHEAERGSRGRSQFYLSRSAPKYCERKPAWKTNLSVSTLNVPLKNHNSRKIARMMTQGFFLIEVETITELIRKREINERFSITKTVYQPILS